MPLLKTLILPTGKLIFHIFGSLAEFVRSLIRERVKSGLESTKKHGKKFGCPDALDNKAKEMGFAKFNEAPKIIAGVRVNLNQSTIK
ncbi:MAG: hypothetical protein RIQ94_2031 [Pseudomonadota bacterium]